MYKVYALYDVADKKRFYVGLTKRSIQKRLSEHIYLSRKRIYPVSTAVLRILDRGGAVDVELLEEYSSEKLARYCEHKWIRRLSRLGHPIVNLNSSLNTTLSKYDAEMAIGDWRSKLLALKKDKWIPKRAAISAEDLPEISEPQRSILASLPMPCLVVSGIIKELKLMGLLRIELRDGVQWAVEPHK